MAKRPNRDEADLVRTFRVKQEAWTRPQAAALGPEMLAFFHKSVEKRQTKLSKIAECWGNLIPEPLLDHCALEGLNRGTLTVLVDSSSHLYDLKQLLLAGLERQLLMACKSAGLRKITLKMGRWYEGEGGEAKVTFR